MAKQRLDYTHRQAIFSNLIAYVTPFALREINKHYVRVKEAQEKKTRLSACTGVFKWTMGLPCSHVIEE